MSLFPLYQISKLDIDFTDIEENVAVCVLYSRNEEIRKRQDKIFVEVHSFSSTVSRLSRSSFSSVQVHNGICSDHMRGPDHMRSFEAISIPIASFIALIPLCVNMQSLCVIRDQPESHAISLCVART